jgi:hypothetical protein
MKYKIPVDELTQKYQASFEVLKALLEYQPPPQYKINFEERHALLCFSLLDFGYKYYSSADVDLIDNFSTRFLDSLDEKYLFQENGFPEERLPQLDEYENYKKIRYSNPSDFHEIIETNYDTSARLVEGGKTAVPGDTNFNARGLLAELRSIWGGFANGLKKEVILESYNIKDHAVSRQSNSDKIA